MMESSKQPLLSSTALSYSSFDSSASEGTSTAKMGTPSDSIKSGSDNVPHEGEKSAGGGGVVVNSKFLKRSGRDVTFDNDSMESFYKPIDEYEGRHRYDPEFEWDPKDEKRIVRKVRSYAEVMVGIQR